MTTPSQLLTAAEVAERLLLSSDTLTRHRINGTGPRYVKLGKHIRYREHDIEAWLEAQSRTSTSERATT